MPLRRLAAVSLALWALAPSPSVAASDAQLIAGQELVAAALRLLETVEGGPTGIEQFLGLSRERELIHQLDDSARVDWSYWPRPRTGLSLGEMDARQRALTHDFLATVLSSRGYLQVFHIVYLENILAATDQGGLPRDISNYSLAFFGRPSNDEPWGWRFEGHHVSLNFTVSAAEIRSTPSFLGANPETVSTGPLTGLRPLRWERDLGVRLMASLSDDQRAAAVLPGKPPADLFAGMLGKPPAAWDAWRNDLRPEGLRLVDLTAPQGVILSELLEQIVATYRGPIADALRSRSGTGDLFLAWLGNSADDSPFYYRLQGPEFLFEFDNGVGENHVHTVLRDPVRDFGRDLLGEHYSSAHSNQP